MRIPDGKARLGLLLVILAVLALTVGGLLRGGILRMPGQQIVGKQKISLSIATNLEPVSLGNFKNGFASVIGPALPAVVNISSSRLVSRPNNVPGFLGGPLFRQFFGNQAPQPSRPQTEREYSLGSGVIINPNGYILTNNHVIAGASEIEVFTQAQKKFKAKLIGSDPRTDIAVLKIDASGLPALTFGDSSKLKVGDLVFAIGDPFGIGETATTGIVSATGRAMGGSIEHYENFIQTDAAINPGNSGGALIDLHGNLVGINTAIISRGGGGNEGVGFAIPANMARNIVQQIVENGKIVRGYLGVTIQAVGPDMAKAFGLPHGGGALIGDVQPNGPAAKDGLQQGDIVVALNGKPVSDADNLSVEISEMTPGTVAHLKIYRNGETMEKDVKLGTYPQSGQTSPQSNSGAGAALQGVQVENLTPQMAQQLALNSQAGVVVTAIDPSSAAASAGIQRGDVIQQVNRKPVANVAQYRQALSGTGRQAVLLLVNHQGESHFVVVEPQ